MGNTPRSSSGRTCREPSALTKERISGSSWKNSAGSKSLTPIFLDRRKDSKRAAGPVSERSWEMGIVSPGEPWTPEVGEFPSVAVVSSLSSILEADVPEKYSLSEKACLGILRRADERGKPLDPLLKAVLERQAGVSPTPSKSEEDVLGGGKGVLVQEDLSATLATHNDQVLFCPAYGFKAGQSARARGLGFEENTAPVLGADMSGTEPTVLCRAIDSHPQDKRVSFSKDGTVQTLPARMGTGGGTSLSCFRLYRQPSFGEFVMSGTASTLLSHLGRDITDLVLAPMKGVAEE